MVVMMHEWLLIVGEGENRFLLCMYVYIMMTKIDLHFSLVSIKGWKDHCCRIFLRIG